MKKLLVVLVLVLFTSCNPPGSENDKHPEKTYKIVTIDKCEYIFISRRPFSSEMALTHKGNCSNPYHKDNQ